MRNISPKSAAQANADAWRHAFAPLDQGDLFSIGKPKAILNIGRACRHCGAETFLPGPGAGPHAARLTCVTCGSFGGWLPKDIAREVSP